MMCSTVPSCAMLGHAMPCCAMLCHAVPCCATLCHAVSCCAMLCHAVPRCAMLCYAMTCCAMMYHAELCCAKLCLWPGTVIHAEQAVVVQAAYKPGRQDQVHRLAPCYGFLLSISALVRFASAASPRAPSSPAGKHDQSTLGPDVERGGGGDGGWQGCSTET